MAPHSEEEPPTPSKEEGYIYACQTCPKMFTSWEWCQIHLTISDGCMKALRRKHPYLVCSEHIQPSSNTGQQDNDLQLLCRIVTPTKSCTKGVLVRKESRNGQMMTRWKSLKLRMDHKAKPKAVRTHRRRRLTRSNLMPNPLRTACVDAPYVTKTLSIGAAVRAISHNMRSVEERWPDR